MIIQNTTISVALTCTTGQTKSTCHRCLDQLRAFWQVFCCLFSAGFTITSDVVGQFYVGVFFGLDLVLVMTRVDAKFRV